MTPAGQAIPGRLVRFLEPYRLTVLIVIATLGVFAMESVSEWAAWSRQVPVGRQIWTAHLSHWSGGHLFWDLLTFTALALLIEKTDRRLLGRLLLFAPPLILAMVWLMEDHAVYRGLSGMDCALYTALIVTGWRKAWIGPRFATFALGLCVGKAVFEICTGQTLFVADLPPGVTAVPWAHLSGAIGGAMLALMAPHSRRPMSSTGIGRKPVPAGNASMST